MKNNIEDEKTMMETEDRKMETEKSEKKKSEKKKSEKLKKLLIRKRNAQLKLKKELEILEIELAAFEAAKEEKRKRIKEEKIIMEGKKREEALTKRMAAMDAKASKRPALKVEVKSNDFLFKIPKVPRKRLDLLKMDDEERKILNNGHFPNASKEILKKDLWNSDDSSNEQPCCSYKNMEYQISQLEEEEGLKDLDSEIEDGEIFFDDAEDDEFVFVFEDINID